MEKEIMDKNEATNNANSSSTKLKLVTTLKWSFLFGCTGGFLYQIIQFLIQYYSYPTVVNIDIMRPNTFIEPSTTFCYDNPVRRSLYCKKYNESCEEPEDMEIFCDKHPHYCNKDVNTSNFKIPIPDVYLYPEDLPQRDLVEFGENQMNITIKWLKDYPPPAMIEKGYWYSKEALRSCQIVHSRVFSEKNPIKRRFSFPQLRQPTLIQRFILTVEEDELFDPRHTPEIIVSLQSPFESHDPYIDGVRLKTGKTYELHINLEEEHLLPPPYSTACLDYFSLWEKDKTRPRSSMGCNDQCMDILTRPCNKCSSTIPDENYDICRGHSMSFCNSTERKILHFKFLDCLKECKMDCRKYIYKFKAQEVPDKARRTNLLGRKRETIIDTVIDEPEIRSFVHKAKYHEVELFSYIGGFMGCWLGISIWSIFYTLLRVRAELKLKEKLKNRLSFRGSFKRSFRGSKKQPKEQSNEKEESKEIEEDKECIQITEEDKEL